MSTLFLILWGIVWTTVFSVLAVSFHLDLIVVHVPIAMMIYCAARRRPIDTWVVTWVVGFYSIFLGGGARGPALFALLAACSVAVFSRRRLKLQSNWRLASTVVAVCMLWSTLFVVWVTGVGGPSYWSTLVLVSPVSAAVTGGFMLVNLWALQRLDPQYRQGANEGPQPLKKR